MDFSFPGQMYSTSASLNTKTNQLLDRQTFTLQEFEQEIEQEHSKDIEQDEVEEKALLQFFYNIWNIYDKRTILLIGLTFFNEGAEFMTILACTIQYYEDWVK